MGKLGHRVTQPERLGHRHDHKRYNLGHRVDHIVHDSESKLEKVGKKVGKSILKHSGEISAVGKGAILASRIPTVASPALLAGGVVASVVGGVGSAKAKKLQQKKAKKASKMLKK